MIKYIKKLFGKKDVVEVQPVEKPKRAYKKRQPKVETPEIQETSVVQEAPVEPVVKPKRAKKEVAPVEVIAEPVVKTKRTKKVEAPVEAPVVTEAPAKKTRKSKKA